MQQGPELETVQNNHMYKNKWFCLAITSCAVIAGGLLAAVCCQNAAPGTTIMSNWIALLSKGPQIRIYELCDRLHGNAKQSCQDYSSAVGEDKWSAAATWRRVDGASFACAGIEAECLQEDMLASTVGSTCRPLLETSDCQQYAFRRQMPPPAKTAAENVAAADPQIPTKAGVTLAHAAPAAPYAAAVQAEFPERRNLYMSSQFVQPVAAWPTATTSVQPGQDARRVQDTFLATSHEYHRLSDYGDERIVDTWAEIFKMLSPSPVIRIGGASQDKMTKVPDDSTWKALKKLQEHTNARFIIGLPLWPKNAVDMSKKIMEKCRTYLGGSVIGYELGNEPEFWPTGLGGYDKDGKWKGGIDAYISWFDRVAHAINPCGSGKKLSGPGWGNVNTQPTNWWAKLLYTGKDCYLWEMTVHYYPYIDNSTVTAKQLLSQPLQEFGLDKFKEYQRISDKERLGVRISETNSLYGGGRPGMSDTLVGGLWVADALFAFAKAGAKAFHLHWGIGGHPSGERGQPNTGVQTNFYYNYNGKQYDFSQLEAMRVDANKLDKPVPYPSVHAPWYGYLFWLTAANGDYSRNADTTIVQSKIEDRGRCGANMKVWALRADNGDLRIALINKDESINCNMKLRLEDPKYCKQIATISRLLPGEEGIWSKGGITWQGQHYDSSGKSGKIQGDKVSQQLLPQFFKNSGKCGFEVPVPASSAALVVAEQS